MALGIVPRSVLAGVSLLLLLPGCRRPPASAPARPAARAADPPFSLDPVVARPSGPGVLIAAPVPPDPNPDPELVDFGDGAARWLQLQVGGHGEFGKTPEWDGREDFTLALGRKRLRLGLSDRLRAAQLTGVTHLALGRISGDRKHAVLVYQLWQVPQLTPVGAPLRLTGSEGELLRQLPSVADQLCLRLQLTTVTPPSQLTPAELAWLGRLSASGRALSPAYSKALEKLGSRSTLAAVDSMFERGRAKDRGTTYRAAEDLARREPQNALVLDAIAHALDQCLCQERLGPAATALQQNLARYPDNLCAHAAEAVSQHAQHHYAAARPAAERALSCSPQNPYAWLLLGDMYRDAADETRRGRFVGQMSSAELRSIQNEYQDELQIRQKQASLCNFRADSWVRLAGTAMMAGDPRLADRSLRTALRLDPSNANAYWTGMELYAPHWYGDAARQKAFARQAVQTRFRTPEDRRLVAQQVWSLVEMRWSWLVVPDPKERAEFLAWVRQQGPQYANLGKPAPKPGTPTAAPPPASRYLYSHTAQVWAIGWDPAGERLATSGRDKVVKVWNARSGAAPPRELLGHQGSVHCLTWSPDGRQLATAGDESAVRIWDPVAASTLRTLPGNCGPIHGLSWTGAGNRLAFSGADGTVHVWDMTANREERVLRGYPGPVSAVAWSPDGKQLAAVGAGGTVRVWDAASGKKLFSLTGPGRHSGDVAWRPDGKQLAATGFDRTLWVWDLPSGEPAVVFRDLPDSPDSVVWSPDGRWLATGGEAPQTLLWDVPGKRLFRSLTGHAVGFNTVAWSRKTGRLASGGGNRDVVVWNTPLAGADTTLRTPPQPPIAPGLTPELLAEYPGKVEAVAFSPDGKLVASAGRDGRVLLQEPRSGSTPRVLPGNPRPVARLAFTPDSRVLVGGVDPRGMLAWELPSEKVLWSQDHLPETLETLAVSPDGRTVASGDRLGRAVYLRDLRTGNETAHASDDGLLLAAALSGNGRLLATGIGSLGRWGDLNLWALPDLHRIRTLTGPTDVIVSAAFSRDSRQVACGSADGTLRVWDVASGKLLHTLRGHEGIVHTVAFLPTGARLLSTGADGTVRLWDLPSGKQLLRLTQPQEKLAVFDLSPDGKRLVTGSTPETGKGHVHLWKLP